MGNSYIIYTRASSASLNNIRILILSGISGLFLLPQKIWNLIGDLPLLGVQSLLSSSYQIFSRQRSAIIRVARQSRGNTSTQISSLGSSPLSIRALRFRLYLSYQSYSIYFPIAEKKINIQIQEVLPSLQLFAKMPLRKGVVSITIYQAALIIQ